MYIYLITQPLYCGLLAKTSASTARFISGTFQCGLFLFIWRMSASHAQIPKLLIPPPWRCREDAVAARIQNLLLAKHVFQAKRELRNLSE
ncbi:MAG: hypothetical protein DMG49_17565 [Acidobacteria bacterium]|nr:MAG: hypothetical protein DMG49_17565 [Acidobacteriota bacterium]